MNADTTVEGIPKANTYIISNGPVGILSSSSTGFTTGHHIITATDMNMRCWMMWRSWLTKAQLYIGGMCQPMKVML